MRATFEADDALGKLGTYEDYQIVSSFTCNKDDYILGFWVEAKDSNNPDRVIPLYINDTQLKALHKRIAYKKSLKYKPWLITADKQKLDTPLEEELIQILITFDKSMDDYKYDVAMKDLLELINH